MVYTVPLSKSILQPGGLQNLVFNLRVNDSTGGAIGSGNYSLSPGVLTTLSTSLSAQGSQVIPRKGEFYITARLVKNLSSGAANIQLMNGYVYNGNDLHWSGEVPIEDGDFMVIVFWNNFTPTGFALQIVGTEVLAK